MVDFEKTPVEPAVCNTPGTLLDLIDVNAVEELFTDAYQKMKE
jgi:hypothetical protein